MEFYAVYIEDWSCTLINSSCPKNIIYVWGRADAEVWFVHVIFMHDLCLYHENTIYNFTEIKQQIPVVIATHYSFYHWKYV